MAQDIWIEDRDRVLRVLNEGRFPSRSFEALERVFAEELPVGYDYISSLRQTLDRMLAENLINVHSDGPRGRKFYSIRREPVEDSYDYYDDYGVDDDNDSNDEDNESIASTQTQEYLGRMQRPSPNTVVYLNPRPELVSMEHIPHRRTANLDTDMSNDDRFRAEIRARAELIAGLRAFEQNG